MSGRRRRKKTVERERSAKWEVAEQERSRQRADRPVITTSQSVANVKCCVARLQAALSSIATWTTSNRLCLNKLTVPKRLNFFCWVSGSYAPVK